MCAESVDAMLTTPPGSIASTKAAKRSDLKDHPNTLDSSGCCTSSVVAKEELTSNISWTCSAAITILSFTCARLTLREMRLMISYNKSFGKKFGRSFVRESMMWWSWHHLAIHFHVQGAMLLQHRAQSLCETFAIHGVSHGSQGTTNNWSWTTTFSWFNVSILWMFALKLAVIFFLSTQKILGWHRQGSARQVSGSLNKCGSWLRSTRPLRLQFTNAILGQIRPNQHGFWLPFYLQSPSLAKGGHSLMNSATTWDHYHSHAHTGSMSKSWSARKRGSGRRLTQQPTLHHFASGWHNSSSHESGNNPLSCACRLQQKKNKHLKLPNQPHQGKHLKQGQNPRVQPMSRWLAQVRKIFNNATEAKRFQWSGLERRGSCVDSSQGEDTNLIP